jgi:hypothetical protein
VLEMIFQALEIRADARNKNVDRVAGRHGSRRALEAGVREHGDVTQKGDEGVRNLPLAQVHP